MFISTGDQRLTGISGIHRLICIVAILFFLGGTQGCATYSHRSLNMRDSLLQGHPEKALVVVEQQDKDHKEVITCLDKGMLRRINGDYAASNQILEVAKNEIEALYGVSISENLASVTINETLRGYEGDRYEQLLLHAFMAMNYIQMNDLDAARVEMLQADVKVREWENKDDDAFVRYLAGLIYEALGEDDEALISYRKAYNLYKEQTGSLYTGVPLNLKKDLIRLTAELGLKNENRKFRQTFNMKAYHPPERDNTTGELVVILNNGLAPVRSENIVHVYSSEVQQNLRIAFPGYEVPKKRLMKPRISITGKQATLEPVEDIDSRARYALEQAMPGIMARAMARAVVKYNSQHSANNDSALAGFLMTVTNLVTERADTRSWSTLPQEIQLQRLHLPAGKHTIHIDMLNAAGYTVDAITRDVEIKPGRLTFVIEHWIAPRIVKSGKSERVTSNDRNKQPSSIPDVL